MTDRLFSSITESREHVPAQIEKELIPISNGTLSDIYLEVMNKINDGYIEGTIKYIQEHHKDLEDKINKADDRINEAWRKCNNGRASIEDFKSALDSYRGLCLRGIELYKKHLNSENNSEDANTYFITL